MSRCDQQEWRLSRCQTKLPPQLRERRVATPGQLLNMKLPFSFDIRTMLSSRSRPTQTEHANDTEGGDIPCRPRIKRKGSTLSSTYGIKNYLKILGSGLHVKAG